MLEALPRNIAKNVMATFFQEKRRELVAHEGEHMKAQVVRYSFVVAFGSSHSVLIFVLFSYKRRQRGGPPKC